MKALRSSFGRLVAAVPGPVHRAVDLRRALGLSAELSWQVFRVATATDASTIAPFIPKPGSIKRLVEVAGARGVSPTIIHAVRDAHEQYERVMVQHAGDRGAFSAIIEGVGAGAGIGIDIKDRRAAFRANRNMWGVQARTRIATSIIVPGLPKGAIDAVVLGALTDFYAVRPVVTVDMQLSIAATDEEGRTPDAHRAATSSDAWEGVGLLRQFSSPQLPTLNTGVSADGVPRASLTLPGIGRSNGISLYYARALHDESRDRISTGGIIHRPCEVAIIDLLLARDQERWCEPSASVYLRIDDVDQVGERRPQDKHPWDVPVTRVEGLREVAPIPEAPDYVAAVASLLERYGWSEREFDLYRVRMEYPVLHSLIEVSVAQRMPDSETGVAL